MTEINASVKVKLGGNLTGHQELFNDHPITISPRLATLIGLNEAIILQQIHYWIRKNMNDPDKKRTHFIDGRWWTYNTIPQWQENFPFWSYNTIKRTISNLEERQILVSDTLHPDPFKKIKWYSINYDAIPSGNTDREESSDRSAQIELMGRMGDTEEDYGKSPSEPSKIPSAQIELIEEPKLSSSYTETNKTDNKNKKEKKAQAPDYDFSKGKGVALKPLPEDWEVLPDLREKVKQEYKLNDRQITDAGKRFKAKNIADGIQKSDWAHAFMYWCSNYKEPRKVYEKVPKDKPKHIDTSNRTGSAPLAKVVENITAKKTQEEQLHSDIIKHLLHKGEVTDLINSGLGELRIEEIDGDCLRFKHRTEEVKASMGQRHLEMILTALRALKPEIKRVEFV